MDNFEQTIQKAKDVLGVAYKKTGEVVTTQKLKIDLISLESKLNRAYAKLGKLHFDAVKDTEIEDAAIKSAVNEVNNVIAEINALKEEIAKNQGKKECPNCGKKVDEASAFCNFCGANFNKE